MRMTRSSYPRSSATAGILWADDGGLLFGAREYVSYVANADADVVLTWSEPREEAGRWRASFTPPLASA